jgi:aryl-alcohol dehydrogenase-like predicted oxidoreductase
LFPTSFSSALLSSDTTQEIVKTAFDNGINMFDTAEAYAQGNSELELCVITSGMGAGLD